MTLLFQRRPGVTTLWLDAQPQAFDIPAGGGWLGLHLRAPAPSSALVVTTTDGVARLEAPGAGWQMISLLGQPLALHAEGPPLRLSGAAGVGPEYPACRLWAGHSELVSEALWHQAEFLGEGRLLGLAGGPVRPFLRLEPGQMGRIRLPLVPLPGPVQPVLSALRGHMPLFRLHGLTLVLRAGAACEILWEAVQLLPKSRANSVLPSRR